MEGWIPQASEYPQTATQHYAGMKSPVEAEQNIDSFVTTTTTNPIHNYVNDMHTYQYTICTLYKDTLLSQCPPYQKIAGAT